MSRVEAVEEAVQALDREELADFRVWFAEYDRAMWDQQLERDPTTREAKPTGRQSTWRPRLPPHGAYLTVPVQQP